MSRLRQLIREIHRRSLWQVLAVFLAAAWGVLQFVDFLTERAGLPEWTPSMALVVLALGLPIVLATAFVQEGMGGSQDPAGGGPEPAPRTPDASPGTAPPTPPAHADPAAPPTGIERVLTWRNALLGGAGALGLVAVAVAAYFVMWSTGIGPVGNLVAQGALDEGDRVILADFTDRTGTGLGEVVTEGLRVDLQESTILSLLPASLVQDGMARMGAPPDGPVTPELARELAIRDGLKAVIQGDVGTVGSGYLLTATILEPTRGEVLASFRSDAGSADDLLPALARLSRDIREKAGESLRIIRAGPGLERVTTSSLEALRIYAQATSMADRGREAEAIPLLEEALRLDPDFAMAHRKLSAILGNLGMDPDRMRASATRAYELRDRLSGREWGLAEAYYYVRVENQPDRAIEAWERVLAEYPDELGVLNNIGVAHQLAGRPEEAGEAFRRLMQFDPDPIPMYHSNFIDVVWQLGEREEAHSVFQQLRERFPESSNALNMDHLLRAADRDWEAALERVARLLNSRAGTPRVDIVNRTEQAGYHFGAGRVTEARRSLELAARAAVEHRQWEWFWAFVMPLRVQSEWVLNHPDRGAAERALREGMAMVPLDSLELRGEGAKNAAGLLALAGRIEEADQLRERIEAAFAPEEKGRTYQGDRQGYLFLRAVGQGNGPEALDALTRMKELRPCPAVCPEQILHGFGLELAGETDGAMAAYEAGLETAPLYWAPVEAAWLPFAFQRLAALHDAAGRREEAQATRQRMTEAYAGAEEPIASRVRAAAGTLAPGGRP
jgi:eukaryotic-like serine/threonine-protein kinase